MLLPIGCVRGTRCSRFVWLACKESLQGRPLVSPLIKRTPHLQSPADVRITPAPKQPWRQTVFHGAKDVFGWDFFQWMANTEPSAFNHTGKTGQAVRQVSCFFNPTMHPDPLEKTGGFPRSSGVVAVVDLLARSRESTVHRRRPPLVLWFPSF